MPVDWQEHIVSTTDIRQGKPGIKGTRIPASLILGYLASGHTTEALRAELPGLRKEQIAACLDFTHVVLLTRTMRVILPPPERPCVSGGRTPPKPPQLLAMSL